MMLQFHVYRKTNTGWMLIASTHFREDADVIVKKWAVAYIACGGDIVFKKGF